MVKDFKRMLYPAFLTLVLILCVSSLSYIINDSYLKNPIALIWNPNLDKPIGYINMLGNLWFLFALFFGKQAFYVVIKYLSRGGFLVYLLIGTIIVVIGQWFYIPFDVLTGISIIPFLYIGWHIQKNGGIENRIPK